MLDERLRLESGGAGGFGGAGVVAGNFSFFAGWLLGWNGGTRYVLAPDGVDDIGIV